MLVKKLTPESGCARTVEIGDLVDACPSIETGVRPTLVPIRLTVWTREPVLAVAMVVARTKKTL